MTRREWRRDRTRGEWVWIIIGAIGGLVLGYGLMVAVLRFAGR